MDPGGGSEAH
uniref:Uncharacterized protein n=1 Tax=Rhizophora mucronata TaxID=61149 RepID=A0A2P2QDS7_RHIMU